MLLKETEEPKAPTEQRWRPAQPLKQEAGGGEPRSEIQAAIREQGRTKWKGLVEPAWG